MVSEDVFYEAVFLIIHVVDVDETFLQMKTTNISGYPNVNYLDDTTGSIHIDLGQLRKAIVIGTYVYMDYT